MLQRVHPNDWDMDGLPNVLDEDPRVPAVVPTRNQSPDWAARAFPGHAAEIASAGGYLAWAAARGGEADRHLVGLNVESPGGVWPVCLSFGDLQVMCDGTRTLYFPVDDGARYPFALSDGAVLASVEVAGEGTLRGVWEDGYEPYEQHVGGVGLRLDSPRSGWVGRTATVQAAPLVPDHFFPGTPRPVSASVTNCHADAYLDCEWRGPSGFSFSNPTSLTTTVENARSDAVYDYHWALTDLEGNERHFVSDEPIVDLAIVNPGDYEIFLFVSNRADAADNDFCVPTSRLLALPLTNYVTSAAGAKPVRPYARPETAATSVHHALDVAVDGAVVVFDVGEHAVAKEIIINSKNDPVTDAQYIFRKCEGKNWLVSKIKFWKISL